MMEGVPSVTSRIVRAVGSVDLAIEALRGDPTEEAQKFISRYDGLSKSDRKRLTLEEIFTAEEITARRFIEIVTGALMDQCGDVTKMMVAVAQPKVTEAIVKAATDRVPIVADVGSARIVVGHTNGDTKAMEIFGKMSGLLPTPKGSTTTVNVNQTNQTAQLNSGDDSCEPPQSADDFLMELQDVVRPKQLQAPPTSVLPVNAPEVDYLEV